MELALVVGYLAVVGLNWYATRGPRVLVFVAKPLIGLVLLVLYATSASHPSPWVFAALVCGLVGDVLLMLPARGPWFPLGLLAFLAGHWAYTAALVAELSGPPGWWIVGPAVAYAAVGTVVLAKLWPSLGPFRGFVVPYVVAILTLGLAGWTKVPPLAAGAAVVGAALFAVSDGLIAFTRFAGAPPREGLVMVTYGLAQLLLTLSFIGG